MNKKLTLALVSLAMLVSIVACTGAGSDSYWNGTAATNEPVNPTNEPVNPTNAPAGSTPVPPVVVSLNYDNGTPDCGNRTNRTEDPLTINQDTYVAYFLCQAINAGTTAAMIDAVQHIQSMAAATGARVWEGTSVTIPLNQAAVVWCSNTTGMVAPNDTAFPLGQERSTALEYDSHNGLGNVFVLPPIGGGTTGRTFSNCNGGNFWAVAVH